MKKKSSLFMKISGGYLVISLIAIAAITYGVIQLGYIAQDAEDVVGTYLKLYTEANQVSKDSIKQIADIQGYEVTGDKSFVRDFNALTESNDAMFQTLIDNAISEEEKTLSTQVRNLNKKYVDIANSKLIPAKQAGKNDEALSVMVSQLVPASTALNAKLTEYKELQQTQMENVLNKSAATANQTRINLIGILVTFIIITVIFSILISVLITKPIKFLKKGLLEAEKQNDLTAQFDIKSGDETGEMAHALNSFINKIRISFMDVFEQSHEVENTVFGVDSNIRNLNAYIEEISATTEELSAGMEETAASTEEVSATTLEISTAVQNIAIKAKEGSDTASEINSRASDLEADFLLSQQKADAIFIEVKAKLENALEESKEVEQINVLANAILEITSQTNLLSLNASIEAARAGEAGRGFAIVANEIGKLAVDSARTANQIQTISELVRKSVNNLAENADNILKFVSVNVRDDYSKMLLATKDYSKDAASVEAMVADFSATTEELLASIENISTVVSEVAIATNEGAQGTTNITNRAVESVRESNKAMEETGHAKDNVIKLIESVSKFRI